MRNPGSVVSRQALSEEIWPSGTLVDFEHSLNTAVKKLRKALGDDPDQPQFIETVPRYGYRFIGEIRNLHAEAAEALAIARTAQRGQVPHNKTGFAAYLGQFTKLDIAALSAAVIVLVMAAAWRQPDWYSARASGKPINSIAILPLQNSTGDSDKEYLAEGMTDALIASVRQFDGISVLPRGAVMSYTATKKPLREVLRELKVDAVVAGTITESNGVVGMNAELVRADAEIPLWSGKYQGKLGNLLRLQDDVAAAIGHQIHVAPPAAVSAKIAKNTAGDSPAYESYLKGRYFLNKRSDQDLDKAGNYFAQAIAADTTFAPAYAGLSDTYTLQTMYGHVTRADGLDKAQATAHKALAMDDNLPEAHTALGGVAAAYQWDWTGAEREFQRAIQLDPSYAPAHHWYAVLCLAPLGRLDEALVEIQRARELEPLSAIVQTDLGFIYYLRGQYPQASDAYAQALEIDPNFVPAHFRKSSLDVQLGKLDDAVNEIVTDMRLTGRSTPKWEQAVRAAETTYRTSGYPAFVRQMMNFERQNFKNGDTSCTDAADHLILGQKDLAFSEFMTAAAAKDPGMLYVGVDPAFKSIRPDPRFQDVLRRMGLPAN